MKLEGNRITLSRVTQDDLDFVGKLECNKEVWLFEESVESDQQVAVAKYHAQMTSDAHLDFVVTIENEQQVMPIGLVQLWTYVSHRGSWELGFGLLPQYQGQGYAIEALRLLVEHAFADQGVRKIVAMCNQHNHKSSALMEKLGMRREGVFIKELVHHGIWCDQYFYALLAEEWKP